MTLRPSRLGTTVDSQDSDSSFIFCFQQVDPKIGEYPPVTSKLGQGIVDRARRVLAARSREELNSLLSLVNFFLEHLNPKGLLTYESLVLRAQIVDAEASGSSLPAKTLDDLPATDCEVSLLFWGLDQLELFSPSETQPPTWSELFAVLALGLLDSAAEEEKYYSSWADKDEWIHEYRLLRHVGYWTQQGERAIAISETLVWADSRESKRRQDQAAAKTKQSQLAAFKRHEKTEKAVLELTRFFQSGRFPSMRSAVAQFCEEKKSVVEHLAPSNRIRTLTEHLSRQLQRRERNGNNT